MPPSVPITIELYDKEASLQPFFRSVDLEGPIVKAEVESELDSKRTGSFNVPTDLYFDWRGHFYLSYLPRGSYVIRLHIEGGYIACRSDHIASCDCTGGGCGIGLSLAEAVE
jgi:hypothetical protein